jgi:hypothetical protein
MLGHERTANRVDVGGMRAHRWGGGGAREGAARIWRLMAEADYPAEVEDFRVFVGAVSEMQDDPQREAVYTNAIRDVAEAMLAQQRS